MKYLNSITPSELGTLWWSKRWVRNLVLLLIPVGLIDAVYTLMTAWTLGPEVEFNPITRLFLESDLWLPWAAIDIIGFAVFSMMTGSYYIHTQNNPEGPDTTWFSLIIAIRVAMATYNVTYFYLPFVIAIYPPFWTAAFMLFLTYFGLDRLLSSGSDISWRNFKDYFNTRIHNYQDKRMIATASRYSQAIREEQSEVSDQPKKPSAFLEDGLPVTKRNWPKKFAYLVSSLIAIIAMMWAIELIGIITGLYTFREQYAAIFFTPMVGQGFIISLAAILFFIAISMFMIIKAFESEKEFHVD